jgi:putative proteasome-type protease
MTYCLGMKVGTGLIAIADTRLTSGTEVTTARKLTVHQLEHHSLFLMTSGLRSVRDKALTYFNEVLEQEDMKFDKLYKAVNAFGEQMRRVASEDKAALKEAGLDFNLHAIVGGQLEHDEEHKLYQLYPQGNWVEVGQGTPFFIIGNSGYGKPLLHRSLNYNSTLHEALKAGQLSFDSTYVSANDVDYPIDVAVYVKDSFNIIQHRFERDDLIGVSKKWNELLKESMNKLPSDWMDVVFTKLNEKAFK